MERSASGTCLLTDQPLSKRLREPSPACRSEDDGDCVQATLGTERQSQTEGHVSFLGDRGARKKETRPPGRTLSWGQDAIPQTEEPRFNNREHLKVSTCAQHFFAALNPWAGHLRACSFRSRDTGRGPGVAAEEQGAGRKGSRLHGQLLLSPEMPLGSLRDRSRNVKEKGTRPVWVSPWFPAPEHLHTARNRGGASSPSPAPDGAWRRDCGGRRGLREERLRRGEWGAERRWRAPPARISKFNR